MKKQLLTIIAAGALLFGCCDQAGAGGTVIPKTVEPPLSGLFSRAITAQGQITLNGGSRNSGIAIDAYNSVLGPYDPVTNRIAAGHIATDATGPRAISIQVAAVCGTAVTGAGGGIFVKNGAIGDLNWCANNRGIEPGWIDHNANIAFANNQPPSGVPTILPTVTSVSGSNITYLSVGSSTAIYQVASLTVSDSTHPIIVTSQATLYVTGDFTVQGNGYIKIMPGASLTLYVGGRAVISGCGVVNANGRPSTFSYIGLPGNKSITYTGASAFYGTINAPQADVTLSGNAEIFGAVICNTYTSSGRARVHYDTALAAPDTATYEDLDLLTDSDGDGLTNLVEYAVGSDPQNAGDGNEDLLIYLTEESGNHYLTMQYKARVNAAALQLQYLPEVSADKITWYSDSAHVLGLSVTPADDQFNWVTIRDSAPITPTTARFIRLHVVLSSLESFSPVWIGSDTLIRANDLTLFSQRMVRPILFAGVVAGVTPNKLVVNNMLPGNQWGTSGLASYVEFDNGGMVDIADASSTTVALTSDASGLGSVGSAYRVRSHFTVNSLFGTSNAAGLLGGPNPARADNILLMTETGGTLSIFWYSNPSFTTWQGWVRADTFTPAGEVVVHPEEGVMVKRIAATDANLYLCGPVKNGVTLAPIQHGYSLLGTLKSLASVPLSALNLYSGDPATGFASGLNPSLGDNLLVVNPNGSVTTYFYYFQENLYSGWVNANGMTLANDVLIPPGSAFFINRQAAGGFYWTIPQE
jgi:hypothetical protein